MSHYMNCSIDLKGEVHHTEGLACRHKNGRTTGSVTIYHGEGAGSFTVSADDPDTLRSLSRAFAKAADDLAVEQIHVEVSA